jgi:hypothetical protein
MVLEGIVSFFKMCRAFSALYVGIDTVGIIKSSREDIEALGEVFSRRLLRQEWSDELYVRA